MMKRILVFCGPHNSGKTTFISKVLPFIVQAGYSVSVVKLTKHTGIFEDEGKDTTCFLGLPSKEVVLVAPDKTVFLLKESLALEDVVERLSGDWILCEGFKGSFYPKVAVYRRFDPDYWSGVDKVVAVVTPSQQPNPWKVPQFTPDEVKGFVKFILTSV